MKVSSVIVTYNRKELLVNNIDMLLSQSWHIDTIYVIDNHSTDNTKEYLFQRGYLNNKQVVLVELPENIGGAGGFYEGTRKAYDDGADFIWLMDDDGHPYNNTTLASMMNFINKHHLENKLLMLNSLVISESNKLSFGTSKINTVQDMERLCEDGCTKDFISPFNGTMITRELVKKIGFPNREFFIKGDETDYYRRAKKVGAFIATVMESVYYHPNLKTEYKKICGKEIGITLEAHWKEYYRVRNYTYMYKTNKEYGELLKFYMIRFIGLVFGKTNQKKSSIFRMHLKGIGDGFASKLGKRVLQ